MADDIQPAGVIHQMSIDLRLDWDSRVIRSLEVDQPFVAIEPSAASRGECCRDPAPRLQALVGEALDGRFARRLGEVFGGALGCSHLLTLFQLMASGLTRAFTLEQALPEAIGVQRRPGERLFRRAVFVDGFEGKDASIEIAIQLGDFHSRPAACVSEPFDRLAREDATRAFARVASPGMTMSELMLVERTRSSENLGSAKWCDRTARLRGLEGTTIIPGLARRLFGIFGEVTTDGEDRLLLDTLLQLAPGHIQVLAAVMDRWFADRESGGPRMSPTAGGASPDIGGIGGMPDSCYMWRSGGSMVSTRSFRGGAGIAETGDRARGEPEPRT